MPQSGMPFSPRSSVTPVCICVDDFGLHPAINAAVCELAAAGRIGATGCMVDGAAWPAGAAALRAMAPDVLDVGLHLDLTETQTAVHGGPRKRPLRACIVDSYRHRLDRGGLQAEVARQFDAFEAAMQRPPAFVDGHQHVHQLPQVREALLAELQRRYPAGGPRPWVRNTRPTSVGSAWAAGPVNALKAQVIAALGSRTFCRQARAAGFDASAGLSGVYGFAGDAAQYRHMLQGWLRHAVAGEVLMCHPAAGEVPGDAIAAARQTEYAVLTSPAWEHMLHALRVAVVPLSRQLQADAQR